MIFRSDYNQNLVMTRLDQPTEFTNNVLDSVIPKIPLDSDTGQHLEYLVREVAEIQSFLPANKRTKSGRIFKPANPSNKELGKRHPGRNKNQ